MAGKVYFGNTNKQQWIKAPLSGMSASPEGYSETSRFLNGGASVRRSNASHRVFNMAWNGSMSNPESPNDLSIIKDFADGLHGEGPFYWVDPYAIDQNLFSPGWAAPFMSIDFDWTGLCPDLEDSPVQRETVLTSSVTGIGTNSQGYPYKTAKYTVAGPNAESYKYTFIIPDGYTLHLGLHGKHGSTGGAFATPYNASGVAGTDVQLTALGVDSSTRMNTSFASTTAKRVEFYLKKTDSGPCEFFIAGLIAQLLPTGVSPASGKFISGRGTQQLEFTGVNIDYTSAAINDGQIGMTATLIESV
jgi:hypothetical protein